MKPNQAEEQQAHLQSLPEIMLRTEAIRAGDVLLSRGLGKESAVIAAGSDGDFSHAAFLTTSQHIFESAGKLISYERLRLLGWATLRSGERLRVSRVPGDPKRVVVYRHPKIETISNEAFQNAFRKILHEHHGRDYPHRDELVALARFPKKLKQRFPMLEWLESPLKRLTARMIGKWDRWQAGDQYIAGPFCSKLVVLFYEQVGLVLFTPAREPGKVTPNDLVASELREQPAVVIRRQQIENFEPIQVSSVDSFLNAGDYMAETMHVMRLHQKSQLRQLKAMKVAATATGELILAIVAIQTNTLGKHSVIANRLGKPLIFSRTIRLWSALNALIPRLMQVAQQAVQEPDEECEIMDAWNDFSISYVRCDAIVSSQLLRQAVKTLEGPLHCIKRSRITTLRRKHLLQSRNHVRQLLKLRRTSI